ncbi:hypothetical protein ACET9X_13415 [Aeromonas veronii]
MPPLKAQLLLEESLSAYFPEMVFTDSGITVQFHRNTQHPRNEAVLVMHKEGLAHWKKISGYHRFSLVETAMYRFKQLLAGKISLRNYDGQVGKVMACVSAINKLNTQGFAC